MFIKRLTFLQSPCVDLFRYVWKAHTPLGTYVVKGHPRLKGASLSFACALAEGDPGRVLNIHPTYTATELMELAQAHWFNMMKTVIEQAFVETEEEANATNN